MSQPAGPEEYRESRARLFVTGWPAAADYRVEADIVVPLDEAGRRVSCEEGAFYMPLARPELPGEFAKVSGGDAEDVLRFVRRYGLPGYAYALTQFEENALQLARREPGFDPVVDKSYDPLLPGDPLPWILAHAETVSLVGSLSAALDTPEQLRGLFERRIVAEDGREELRFIRAVRGQTRPKEGRLPVPDAKSRRATAINIIALCLNENLGGVSRAVGIDAGRLVSLFRPNTLLDGIYWLLADATTRAQLRVCEECGHFFAATDERMKYCPPPMGLEGPSRCMHRLKVRKWREGQRRQARRKHRPSSHRRGGKR